MAIKVCILLIYGKIDRHNKQTNRTLTHYIACKSSYIILNTSQNTATEGKINLKKIIIKYHKANEKQITNKSN